MITLKVKLMRMLSTIALALAVLFSSCEKRSSLVDHKIYIGKVDSLFSQVLNENRKIWIHVPSTSSKTKTKYPVIYLLDGDIHFSSVVGLVDQLSKANGNSLCPEMIIVAIPNTDRTRDLTPSFVKNVFGDSTFSRTSGGSENFTKFISEELILYIDANYPTAPNRTLIGHSFGGLFAINTLIHHPDLFTNYIAIDPSLWWDNQKMLKNASLIFNSDKLNKKSLYIAIANTMAEGMDLKSVAKDTTATTVHVRSILKFEDFIKDSESGLSFESKFYPTDDHISVPLIAEHDAIRWMFSWYRMKGLDAFFDRQSNLTPESLITRITDHYKSVSQHLGYPVTPPENSINSLASGFISFGMKNKAKALLDFNLNNHPESDAAYEALGDFYLAQNDTAQAIAEFKNSLAIKESQSTRDKLTKIRSN